ncbi:MAG: hypothetical protein HZB10_01405 [Candidatus Yonathbacteria bacterium]|nr:hypothetical protein [Candidatus Yonathbacteria bacterium]
MFNIHELATLTAQRARELGLRPNQVVHTICREAGVHSSAHDDIKKLILSECGRRGGKAPRVKRKSRCQELTVPGLSRAELVADTTRHEAELTAGIPEDDL